MRFLPALLLAATTSVPMLAQQPLTADAIMARVAANQDAAVAGRAHYVYVQHARVLSRKGNTVRCEEVTDSRVTPTASGSEQHLLKLDGRVLYKGKYFPYTTLDGPKEVPPGEDPDSDSVRKSLGKIDEDTQTDRELVESMRKNLTDDTSRDGLASDLFPLSSTSQKDLVFTLAGRELSNGRDTYHITFRPKDKDDFGWKGDAWIDTRDFQPVVVRTAMAKQIPFAVRTLLGTSLPGLGFTVTYAPQKDGLWFPATFGTEFRLHVLFFFSREIVLSVENRDFERTHTSSTILSTGSPQ